MKKSNSIQVIFLILFIQAQLLFAQDIFMAVSRGNIKQVESLLSETSNLAGTIDSKGNTPLHIALSKSDTNMVKLLISKGSNLDIPNARGLTPIQLAIISGERNIIEVLLENGADFNKKNEK